MRNRKDIESDHHSYDILSLEVLLDIRDLLNNKGEAPSIVKPKRGRPKKETNGNSNTNKANKKGIRGNR